MPVSSYLAQPLAVELMQRKYGGDLLTIIAITEMVLAIQSCDFGLSL